MDDKTQDLITDVTRQIRMGHPVETADLEEWHKHAVPAFEFLQNAGKQYQLVTVDLMAKIEMVERWLEYRKRENK